MLRVWFLVFIVLWFPSALKRWTHSFRPAKCLIEWPFVAEWETEPLREELAEVLNAPFSYLGKGTQSYVFLSQDGEYVLKLFRFDGCKMQLGHRWMTALKGCFGIEDKDPIVSIDRKIEKNFSSCKLAYSLAKEQTGLVYVHLNPKNSKLPPLKLKDKLGIPHTIDPSKYRFVLQRRAEKFFAKMLKEPEKREELIRSYLTLLDEIAALGLVNLDPTVARNFGVLDGKVVLIDVGNFIYWPELAEKEKGPFKEGLRKWLAKRNCLSGCGL